MTKGIRQTLESSSILKRSPKKQILCDAIEQNRLNLERTIQVYVTRVVKQFGNKFDLSGDRNSIQTVATEILNITVETVLNKSEEFDPSYPPFPWIKGIAANQVRGWQRDKTRNSKKVVSIGKISSQNNLSEEEILGILFKPFQLSDGDSTMLEYLLSLVNEHDRQILKLAFIDDLNGKDLAAALGVSEGTAYTKKSRAINRLRKAYTQANQDIQEGK